MNKCPRCNQLYDAGSIFCINDGTTLIAVAPKVDDRFVVSLDDGPFNNETPTQFVPKTLPVPETQAADHSKLIYAVVGALGGIILVLFGYIVLLAPTNKTASTPNANSQNSNPVIGPTLPNVGGLTTNAAPAARNANVSNSVPTAANYVGTNVNTVSRDMRNTTPERAFSRTFTGTVGDNAVELDLNRNGSTLGGRVRPYGRSAEIYVNGYISDDGTFSMDEKSDIGVVTGVYRGRLNSDGTMTGTWSKPGGEKPRPLFMRRQ